MPTENQGNDPITASLGLALRAELADVHASPGLGAAVRRKHSRQMWTLRIAAAVPAVIAAAAVTIVAMSNPGGTAPADGSANATAASSRSSTRPGPEIRTVAYVSEHADSALAATNDLIVKTSTRSESGTVSRIATMTDLATGRSRFDSWNTANQPMYSNSLALRWEQSQTELVVDHINRAWWTTELRAAPEARTKVKSYYQYSPESIREALRSGSMQIIGDEQIDGRAALHLRLANLPSGLPAQLDLWIDPSSYLPMRVVNVKDQGHGTQLTGTVDYEWLRRTAENLAVIDLKAPAGYTHSSQPIDPPAGPGGGVG